ncbi:hypothetical protein CYY_008863 [Polysphondylium violaceum]|uniref:PARP n=1 Tax=Polysphondylium violaceum TaxID=133409 RepID=A0A8J4UWL4_9MYCE|nr:hypothetical protein CYY_008863 [Polysphondylium violaceum]
MVMIIEELADEFQKKPLECDIMISLFYLTVHSPKQQTICNPFPSSHLKSVGNNIRIKDFDGISKLLSEIPDVYSLSNIETLNKLSKECLQLLYFILFHNSDSFSIEIKDFKEYEKKTNGYLISESLDHFKSSSIASHVFKLKYNEKRYKEAAKEKGVVLGYHGSSNENWYNIIKGRGFSFQFASEESLFGKGIYFSSDSKVSHCFIKWSSTDIAPSAASKKQWWPQSVWSKKDKIGILAACQILNTIDTHRGLLVKMRHKKNSTSSSTIYNHTDKDRELPGHYILSTEPTEIQVKYLLLFSENDIINNNSSSSSSNNRNNINNSNHNNRQINNSKFRFFKPMYIFLFIFLSYIILLVWVGSNDKSSNTKSGNKKVIFH